MQSGVEVRTCKQRMQYTHHLLMRNYVFQETRPDGIQKSNGIYELIFSSTGGVPG